MAGEYADNQAVVRGGKRTARRTRVDRPPPPTTVDGPPSPLPAKETTGSVLVDSVMPPATVVTETRMIADDHIGALWAMYEANIGPLDDVAALKHLDDRDHIIGCFRHPDIIKLVAWSGDEPVGIAMITNNLDLVIEISPRFFQAKYPEHAAAGTLYYGMVIVVDQSHRGMTAFSKLYMQMWNVPAKVSGVMAFDVCKFNRDSFQVDTLVDSIAGLFPHSSVDLVDQQTFYVAELPEALD